LRLFEATRGHLVQSLSEQTEAKMLRSRTRLFGIFGFAVALLVTPGRAEPPPGKCPPLSGIVVALAQGSHGSSLWVRIQNGSREVWKVFDEETDFQTELQRWESLDRFFPRKRERQLGISWEPIRTAQEAGARALVRPFRQVRTLHEILLDPSVPKELKQALRMRYRSATASMRFRIMREVAEDETHVTPVSAEEDWFRDGRFDGEQGLYVRDYRGGIVELLIKTVNIIVDPNTLEFTLIDPY
jgi:hypothetical protein